MVDVGVHLPAVRQPGRGGECTCRQPGTCRHALGGYLEGFVQPDRHAPERAGQHAVARIAAAIAGGKVERSFAPAQHTVVGPEIGRRASDVDCPGCHREAVLRVERNRHLERGRQVAQPTAPIAVAREIEVAVQIVGGNPTCHLDVGQHANTQDGVVTVGTAFDADQLGVIPEPQGTVRERTCGRRQRAATESGRRQRVGAGDGSARSAGTCLCRSEMRQGEHQRDSESEHVHAFIVVYGRMQACCRLTLCIGQTCTGKPEGPRARWRERAGSILTAGRCRAGWSASRGCCRRSRRYRRYHRYHPSGSPGRPV